MWHDIPRYLGLCCVVEVFTVLEADTIAHILLMRKLNC